MHINNNNLTNFQTEKMTTDELIVFLEHLDTCDYCLEQLINNQNSFQTAAPAYMKETIMNRARDTDTQVQKTAVNATHQIHLFYEGLRTVVGVVLALIMLFSLGQINCFSPQYLQSPSQSAKERLEAQTSFHNFSDGITDSFSGGSKKIVDYINSISNTIANGGN
nr:hypothetical protein [uncultured Blautia sp.]